MPKRKWLVMALVVFLVVSGAAVIVNSLCFGRGLDFYRSISRYVGFETWSAVTFALANGFVGAMMGKYLWRLGEKWRMPRLYYYAVIFIVATLIGLSCCPIGFFDVDGKKSAVSLVHEFCSRSMFIVMLITSAMLAENKNSGALTHGLALGFIVYGVVWIAGYMTQAAWMMPIMLIMEAVYITWFIVLAISCEAKQPNAHRLRLKRN